MITKRTGAPLRTFSRSGEKLLNRTRPLVKITEWVPGGASASTWPGGLGAVNRGWLILDRRARCPGQGGETDAGTANFDDRGVALGDRPGRHRGGAVPEGSARVPAHSDRRRVRVPYRPGGHRRV